MNLSQNVKNWSLFLGVSAFGFYKGTSCEGQPYPASPLEIHNPCKDTANKVNHVLNSDQNKP